MATATPNSELPSGGWTVGSQVQETRFNASGQPVRGVTIHFQSASGVASTVWVPESDYNPQTVKALISSKVKTIDAIAGLSE